MVAVVAFFLLKMEIFYCCGRALPALHNDAETGPLTSLWSKPWARAAEYKSCCLPWQLTAVSCSSSGIMAIYHCDCPHSVHNHIQKVSESCWWQRQVSCNHRHGGGKRRGKNKRWRQGTDKNCVFVYAFVGFHCLSEINVCKRHNKK